VNSKPHPVQPQIYLASQSPRRAQLLDQLGVRYALLLADAQEDAESLEQVLLGEKPLTYVRRVTQLKLQASIARMKRRGLPALPVLCSDTTVALGQNILGKPQSEAHARQMLTQLSGQTHRVLTCVALGTVRKQRLVVQESKVRFSPISAAQIRAYVASGEPMGKAGSYAVQGQAARFIEHISGSYSGIMGLPLFETAQLLAEFSVR
jgi:septum formation protein